ncbi:uncharacterized protein TRIADDRAFT_28445, partial [Trichoplax adhaerens]
DVKKKTRKIKNNLNPEWNETLEFDLNGKPLTRNEQLEIQVKDWEMLQSSRYVVTLTVEYQGAPNDENQSASKDDSGGGVITDENDPTVVQEGDDKNDSDENESSEADEDRAAKPSVGAITYGGGKKRRVRRLRRSKLSNKPQDFQVRIKIIEGRQLSGSNISPVVRISVANQSRQTRVRKATNKPFYDEMFFFNFHMSPQELFDELIVFQVFNARKLRHNSLIGSFKIDIGMVYEGDQHAFLNKWIMLTNPEDIGQGVKGYIKMCVIILGAGDEAPTIPDSHVEKDDIEENVLQPAGIQLRPATYSLKAYRAVDIPRMDKGVFEGVKKFFGHGDDSKSLVDPYIYFSYAGHKVKSKTICNSDNPEWRQYLNIGSRFPSMCERLQISIYDWDRMNKDDVIGTYFLNIAEISSSSDSKVIIIKMTTFIVTGFPPTFGPSFVNFYGSPREYSDLPDEYEDLNRGKGEGVAYRGRALIELVTNVGEMPEYPVNNIEDPEVERAKIFMRTRKYCLHATFMEATMITVADAPIEFEISIGNYGNKLDDTVAAASSTTQPTNAVYDGNHFYFLPWFDNKPCVAVNADWEDISYRIDNYNCLCRICDRLEENIKVVKNSYRRDLPTAEIAAQLIGLIDTLIIDTKKDLGSFDKAIWTELDGQLHSMRLSELAGIRVEAERLRESATDIKEVITECEGYLQRLRDIAIEPQNSLPDVILWMLCGNKRVAYYRMPACDVLHSMNEDPDATGKYCGKVQTIAMKYPGKKSRSKRHWDIPCFLRLQVWLGLAKNESIWTNNIHSRGEISIVAETYENQMNVVGMWTSKGLPRPKFSDARGTVSLHKDHFVEPQGWKFEGDWFISVESSIQYDLDSGRKVFLEDVFENESRVIPGGPWQAAGDPWTDVKGDHATDRDEIPLPEGWVWEAEWQIDLNRAVDEHGWEYTLSSGYSSVEKNYHLYRRRRWVRRRKLTTSLLKHGTAKKKPPKDDDDVWEYAKMFITKFHSNRAKSDLVRRRRWHRNLKAVKPNKLPILYLVVSKSESLSINVLVTPNMFNYLLFLEPRKFQLRAYIYQARDLLAGDSNGLSDPFARVAFLNMSQETETISMTLCPTWDQTLIFDNVEIFGNTEDIMLNPPPIVIEIFDYDKFGSPEYLGRTMVSPMVKWNPNEARTPKLAWCKIERSNEYGGELLAAFELLLDEGADLPFAPTKKDNVYIVPPGIRPVLRRTAIEVLCWGVRNLKRYHLLDVHSPSIELECGGNIQKSATIKHVKRNPNFSDPVIFFDIMLPKEEIYTPPMNIRVIDHRAFGRKPIVGVCVLKRLMDYQCEPATSSDDVPELPDGCECKVLILTATLCYNIALLYKDTPKQKEETDWWCKYYASRPHSDEIRKAGDYLERGYYTIKIFDCELEKQDEFHGFQDLIQSFSLHRGKNKKGSREDDDATTVGEFKGSFRVYPLPADPNITLPPRIFQSLPPSNVVHCTVRIYIIRAFDLSPKDASGLSDPYCIVSIGKNKIKDRENYIANDLNPLFGRMFELSCQLPLEKDLKVSIMDWDLISKDDLIGETVIDLENRYLSRYRATCGLPKNYCTSGINQWRDSQTPKEILDAWCESRGLPAVRYISNTQLLMDGRIYSLDDYEQNIKQHEHLGPADQRLALHALLSQTVVQEHIETRPLYSPLQPLIEQGRLQMWIDIFPKELGTPGPPFDISPRKPKLYELRVIIYNTSAVILNDKSITGQQMSDIYVKGWIRGIDKKAKTDVHYRSLDGSGNFNWRFIFPFDYMPAEKCLVISKKKHFWSLDKTTQMIPPVLQVQIWDNDLFSPDDYLGTLELDLNSLCKPAKSDKKCGLKQLPDWEDRSNAKDMVSLFEMKQMHGWWPLVNEDTKNRQLTGKIEMSIEILTAEEASLKPAGIGRSDPNAHPHLDAPNRPATSFLWFTSPLKSCRFIVWPNIRYYCCIAVCILILVIFVLVFIYAIPVSE